MCYFMGKESPEIMAFKWKLRINLRHNFESSASVHLFGHFAVIKINFQRATHDYTKDVFHSVCGHLKSHPMAW